MQFDLLRACFWLVAGVVAVVMVIVLIAAGGCLVATLHGMQPSGTCIKLGLPGLMREAWQDVLTVILALLALRFPPGPPPPPSESD